MREYVRIYCVLAKNIHFPKEIWHPSRGVDFVHRRKLRLLPFSAPGHRGRAGLAWPRQESIGGRTEVYFDTIGEGIGAKADCDRRPVAENPSVVDVIVARAFERREKRGVFALPRSLRVEKRRAAAVVPSQEKHLRVSEECWISGARQSLFGFPDFGLRRFFRAGLGGDEESRCRQSKESLAKGAEESGIHSSEACEGFAICGRGVTAWVRRFI